MSWVKLDDHFDENRKILAAGPLGAVLWTAGLAYCNRNNTRGLIPLSAARTLIDWQFVGPPDADGKRRQYVIGVSCGMAGTDMTTDFAIDLLLANGLWEMEDDVTYRVHDYDKYQLTPDEKRSLNLARSEAGKKGAASRWQNRQNDSKPMANDMAKSWPVPDPVPVPKEAAASAASSLRTREGEPADDAHTRCYRAWQNQSPGGLNRYVLDGIDGLLEEGLAPEVFEDACKRAGEAGGNKPWKYVESIIRRLKSGAPEKTRVTGTNGETFVSGIADMIMPNTNLRIVEDAG